MHFSFLITLIGITKLVCGGLITPENQDSFAEGDPILMDEKLVSILSNSTLGGVVPQKANAIEINTNSSEPIALSKLSSPAQILQMHNIRRFYHQVPPLSWSQGLTNYAQAWANKCHYGHTNDPRYGENIAMGLHSWESTMKAWSDDEEGLFDYRHGGFSQATGHFTQIVWKDTSMVGCAVQQCPRVGIEARPKPTDRF
ncbi:CAP domain-containing protein [Chlamydoabsidia padenii]|nr:CAP domain-containing protein [Chlamydoabsidia padenii]